MKITFTGITQEGAVQKLEAAAADCRAFAARITSKGEAYAALVAQEESKADHYEAIARTIKSADSDSISIGDADMGLFSLAMARGTATFEEADSLFKATLESIEECPFEIMLAEGKKEAAKYESL